MTFIPPPERLHDPAVMSWLVSRLVSLVEVDGAQRFDDLLGAMDDAFVERLFGDEPEWHALACALLDVAPAKALAPWGPLLLARWRSFPPIVAKEALGVLGTLRVPGLVPALLAYLAETPTAPPLPVVEGIAAAVSCLGPEAQPVAEARLARDEWAAEWEEDSVWRWRDAQMTAAAGSELFAEAATLAVNALEATSGADAAEKEMARTALFFRLAAASDGRLVALLQSRLELSSPPLDSQAELFAPGAPLELAERALAMMAGEYVGLDEAADLLPPDEEGAPKAVRQVHAFLRALSDRRSSALPEKGGREKGGDPLVVALVAAAALLPYLRDVDTLEEIAPERLLALADSPLVMSRDLDVLADLWQRSPIGARMDAARAAIAAHRKAGNYKVPGAMHLLGRDRSDEARAVLVEALRESEPTEAYFALSALPRHGAAAEADILAWLADVPPDVVPLDVYPALAAVGGEATQEWLRARFEFIRSAEILSSRPGDLLAWSEAVATVPDPGLLDLLEEAVALNPELRGDYLEACAALGEARPTAADGWSELRDQWAVWLEERAEEDQRLSDDDWLDDDEWIWDDEDRLDPQDPPAPRPEPIRVIKIGRNEPCPCGSGKKYKKCCLGKVV